MGVLRKILTFSEVHIPSFALDCEESGKCWPYNNGFVALLGQVLVRPPTLLSSMVVSCPPVFSGLPPSPGIHKCDQCAAL